MTQTGRNHRHDDVALQILLSRPGAFPVCKQCRRTYLERDGKLLNDSCRRIAGASLDSADIGPMQPTLECEILLRQAAGLTKFAKVLTDEGLNIHRRSEAAM